MKHNKNFAHTLQSTRSLPLYIAVPALCGLLFLPSCSPRNAMPMLTLTERRPLEGIPSASGVEPWRDGWLVIGDDSPHVFRLDRDGRIIERWPLLPGQPDRLPKAHKPDLEAMTLAPLPSGPLLLVFGSGSKSPQRDTVYILDPEEPSAVRPCPATALYRALGEAGGLQEGELNLEAAAADAETLWLFNRGPTVVFALPLAGLLAHLEGGGPIPPLQAFRASLPALEGYASGFSGATLTPDGQALLFTASVERTANWYDDGPIVGSLVGILPLRDLRDGVKPRCAPLAADGKNLPVKAEGLAVDGQEKDGSLRLILVTDSDDGGSEWIRIEFRS